MVQGEDRGGSAGEELEEGEAQAGLALVGHAESGLVSGEGAAKATPGGGHTVEAAWLARANRIGTKHGYGCGMRTPFGYTPGEARGGRMGIVIWFAVLYAAVWTYRRTSGQPQTKAEREQDAAAGRAIRGSFSILLGPLAGSGAPEFVGPPPVSFEPDGDHVERVGAPERPGA